MDLSQALTHIITIMLKLLQKNVSFTAKDAHILQKMTMLDVFACSTLENEMSLQLKTFLVLIN